MQIANRLIPATIIVCGLLSLAGCVPIVSGDLADVPHPQYPSCLRFDPPYRIDVESDAEDAYASGRMFWLTEISLGLIPTFESHVVSSQARLYREGVLLQTYRFRSRITVYYGWLWLLFKDPDSVNALSVDEGAGVRETSGIRDRTIAKALADSGLDVGPDQICYIR